MRISTNSIARWREEVCRHLLRFDFEPASGAQFRGTMLALMNANGVRVGQMGYTPGRALRDHRLAKDGSDTVALVLATGGAIQVSQNGREVQLYRGGASLLRNWEPGAVALNREGGYTVVLIPNGPFQRCEAIDAFSGRRLPGTTALNLIKSYVSSLRTGRDRADGELAQLASAHLVELARLALTTGAERAEAAESSSIAEVRLRVALELMASRHCEPDLCVNDIAAAQGVSVRYLQKLLEKKGISFSSHINDLRLQTAHAALCQCGAKSASITDIALNCGFRDLSYFNRLFRRHFGDTPTGVRSAATGRE